MPRPIASRLAAALSRTYLHMDPRSLGLFRIVYGAVLLLTLSWRLDALENFYTNQGLMPNHTMLWAAPSRYMFSLFFTASSAAEARVGMTLCGLVFTSLMLGYRTRLCQVLSLICLVSINSRQLLLETGGDMVLNMLGMWTLWLPLGQRFSIDALLESLRTTDEREPAALGVPHPVTTAPVVSLAMLALILQFGLAYFFNVAHKTGPTWRDGLAVHLVLHQDRVATAFAVWARQLPFGVLQFATYATIVIEAVGCAFILSPVGTHYTRLVVVFMMPFLHLCFASCLNLGPFSYAMSAFYPLLLGPRHWEALYGWLRRRVRPRTLHYDPSDALSFAGLRLLKRLDLLGRLSFAPDAIDDAQHARRNGRIATFLGLAAPGAVARSPSVPPPTPPPRSPARLALGRYGRLLGEGYVALMMVACTGEIMKANPAVPRALRYEQPEFLQALIEYPRLLQGWRMFAPDAPLEDYWLSVEARTVDGRLVDPYNEVASRYKTPPFNRIPPRLGMDQFFTSHALFMPSGRFGPFRLAFKDWILAYPKRTGRPQDSIVSFVAYQLIDQSPPPGQLEPRNFRRLVFMTHPEVPPVRPRATPPRPPPRH